MDSEKWKSIYLPGAIGSEGGVVFADEEYKESCRITLEKCENCYAITCGVYGAMVHTTYAGSKDHQEKYDAMKQDLEEFIDKETTFEEECDFYEKFTSKY